MCKGDQVIILSNEEVESLETVNLALRHWNEPTSAKPTATRSIEPRPKGLAKRVPRIGFWKAFILKRAKKEVCMKRLIKLAL
jgi:hypothetical protein